VPRTIAPISHTTIVGIHAAQCPHQARVSLSSRQEGFRDVDDDARIIGARARMIRRRRGLSLEVVAGLASITAPYLSIYGLAVPISRRLFSPCC
jgi:hypothetical protein